MINKNVFWIFALMLMIITLSGSLSNALEVNENFLDEVLELNDAHEDQPIYGYSGFPLYSNVENCSEENIQEEDEIVIQSPPREEILRPVASQPQHQPKRQPQPQPQPQRQPQRQPQHQHQHQPQPQPQPQHQPQPQPQPQHQPQYQPRPNPHHQNHNHHHHPHRIPVNLQKPQPIINPNMKSENEMLGGYSGQFYAPF